MSKEQKESDLSGLLGGTLDILGLKIDLGELLSAPENLKDRLEELRERLKAAGGKEAASDEEWRQGAPTITGHIRTRGIFGDQEYHLGTTGRPGRAGTGRSVPPSHEQTVEPPVDVFVEGQQVTIVADVPGVRLEDLDLVVAGDVFSLSTKGTARRAYRKVLHLETMVDPESLQATCRNGVLQVRLLQKGPEPKSPPAGKDRT